MASWKSVLERAREKRNEMAASALKKAAKATGKAIERVVFGNLDDEEDANKAPPQDPFAKLKAAEAEKKERERKEKREAGEEAVEKGLAELKNKLGK